MIQESTVLPILKFDTRVTFVVLIERYLKWRVSGFTRALPIDSEV